MPHPSDANSESRNIGSENAREDEKNAYRAKYGNAGFGERRAIDLGLAPRADPNRKKYQV